MIEGGEKCSRCELYLPPGARHPGPADCVEALKAKLRACERCGGTIGCLKCSVKRTVRNELNARAPGTAQALRFLGEILKPEDG